MVTSTREARGPCVGGWSPWGTIDYIERLENAPAGVVFVSTPSHGGAFVPDAVPMDEGLRTIGTRDRALGGRWFEEDCCICAVALQWPRDPRDGLRALGLLRELYPRHVDGGSGCGREATFPNFHDCVRS